MFQFVDVVETMLCRGTVCSYPCCCCCLVSMVMVRVRVANSSGGRIRGVLPVVLVTILLCSGSRVNLCVRNLVIL